MFGCWRMCALWRHWHHTARQVVGDTQAAFDITQYDTLVFGAHGLLLAGPNSRTYEPLLASYLQLLSMDLFVRNLYNRMLITMDDIAEVSSVGLWQLESSNSCQCMTCAA
jgi:hypothetical protein